MNFDPSSSNRLRIYLSSTNPSLNEPLQGYFLQIGESGPEDGFDLYRQDSLAAVRTLEGPAVTRNPDTPRCRFPIQRDTSGAGEIRDRQSVDPGKGESVRGDLGGRRTIKKK